MNSSSYVPDIDSIRYSTIWLAKALPDDGQVISLEVSEEYASVRIKMFRITPTH